MLPGLAMNGMYTATETVQEGANFRLFKICAVMALRHIPRGEVK